MPKYQLVARKIDGGGQVNPGDTIGQVGDRVITLKQATSPTVPGKSGKILTNEGRECYAHIYGLRVDYVTPEEMD